MSETPDWNIPYVPENTLDPAAGLNLSLLRVDEALTDIDDAAEKVLTSGANITIDRTDPANPVISATGGGGGSANWGAIGGTLADQTDLANALNSKVNSSALAEVATSGNAEDVTVADAGNYFTGDNVEDILQEIGSSGGGGGAATAIPQNSQSAAYTLVLADAGKHILHPSADTTSRTFTIPANASVAFPVGTVVTFVNQNAAGVLTIAITSDTMRLAGAGTTGSRTLAANGIATAIKLTATEWIISGVGLT